MKKLFSILLTVFLILSLVACASSNDTESETETAKEPEATVSSDQTADQPVSGAADSNPTDSISDDTAVTPPAESEAGNPEQNNSKVLVVVFSATGTTMGVAEKIAAIENADLYEIKAAQEYTSDDLNWHDSSSRSTLEQNDNNARPEIGSESISLEGYEKIYIGYPIWWGQAPRIMSTFVESYDFTGITVIPFCTSGSSDIGQSDDALAELSATGNWLQGRRFSGEVSEDELRAWIGETEATNVEKTLHLYINDTEVAADWEDNESVSALKDLVSAAPLTVRMSMYGGFEQVGSLGTRLPRDDSQTTTQAGDIVLYSGDQLVIFYGSNSWAYTRLGRITDRSPAELEALLGGGDVTVTLSFE